MTDRNLLKQYALKGAKCGAMVGMFVGFPIAYYHHGRECRRECRYIRERCFTDTKFQFSVPLNARFDSIATGVFAVISPIVGAIVGSIYAICERYGFNDMIKRNKKNILYPVSVYALCHLTYYIGYRYGHGYEYEGHLY